MNRIDQTFKSLQTAGRAALIPFIVAGDPDLSVTEVLIHKMAASGADIIELGVPFSDPLADGPIIQSAYQRALQKGTNLKGIFQMVEKLKGNSPPLVLMTYFNPVLHYGLRSFAEDCRQGGIAGVIIPDLPPEEARPWIKEARKNGVATIFLLAPTSSEERIRLVDKVTRGFIYYVSRTGVTGVQTMLAEELEGVVLRIKGHSPKPVAVGFGISTAEQAKEIRRFADGIIVGSAIVKIMEDEPVTDRLVERVGTFISALSHVLK